jgi:hypothetical protein
MVYPKTLFKNFEKRSFHFVQNAIYLKQESVRLTTKSRRYDFEKCTFCGIGMCALYKNGRLGGRDWLIAQIHRQEPV